MDTIRARSGPPVAELPYRYGCACGATWNSDGPLDDSHQLCGPYCRPTLFELGCPCVGTADEEDCPHA